MNIFKILKVADLFTTANLSCGVLSIFTASNENYDIAALLMVIAIIMDSVDGKVAKLMHQTNRFGKELDSLADLILFVVCGMWRLARYNISQTEGFEGVPITVNGVIFPLLYILHIYQPASLVIWPAVFATMSALMISSLRVQRII